MGRFKLGSVNGVVVRKENDKIIVYDSYEERCLDLKVTPELSEKKLCVGDSIDFDIILVGENVDGNVFGNIEYEFKSKELEACELIQIRK